jgi:hypothetical protein
LAKEVVVGLFDFLKKKQSPSVPDTDDLTEAELPNAFKLAEIAGIVMRMQFRSAAIYGAGRKDEAIWPSQAFAFGVLISALQSKGIAWTKAPYVSIKFAEVYMPDYKDHKELARLICHFGVDPTFIFGASAISWRV